ncbi:MAG: hypothetical protein V2G51_06465 [bacterium JZ-2024 1]
MAKEDASPSLKQRVQGAVVAALTRQMSLKEFASLVEQERKRWEEEIQRADGRGVI